MKSARLLAGMVFLGLIPSGCSFSKLGQEAEVSGKVMYNGKPLPGGHVTFMNSKGYTFGSVIDPEGNYKLKATVGEVRITVDNSMLMKKDEPGTPDLRHPPGVTPPPGVQQDADKSSAPKITGTYVHLPEKYRSPDASGLTYTVTKGPQTHDIELSP